MIHFAPSKDAMIHAGIAFLVSCAFAYWSPALAFAIPTAFFYGREMRDAERYDYRLMTSIGRFLPWRWHQASQKEFLHPLFTAAIPALIGWLLPLH